MPGPFSFYNPAWCLAEDELIIATSPSDVEARLARDREVPTLAEIDEVARLLQGPTSPLMLTYQDTAAMVSGVGRMWPVLGMLASARPGTQAPAIVLPPLPEVDVLQHYAEPSVAALVRTDRGLVVSRRQSIPLLGFDAASLAAVEVSMVMPLAWTARFNLDRLRSNENLESLGVALAQYDSVFRRLPADSAGAAGEPLLSWRVHLLPFLGELELYKSLRLDEPWDSPYNRRLAARMPSVYRNPRISLRGREDYTNYLAVKGPGTLFAEDRPLALADCSDGADQTVLVIEAASDRSVVWTQPADLLADPSDPRAGLSGLAGGGCLALFADGAVRHIDLAAVTDQTLRALFTCSGGDVPGEF
jgi:hypothetical protein